MAFYELKDTSKMSQEEITKSGLQPVMTQTEMEVNDETFGVGRIKDCGDTRCGEFSKMIYSESKTKFGDSPN